jgi:hypothetical protein
MSQAARSLLGRCWHRCGRAARGAWPSVTLLLAASVLAGCPDGGGAQDPSSVQGPGTGPLAGLEASPFQNEVWLADGGQQTPILYYPRENVRVSAACRQASGQFVCEGVRFLRNGLPVEIARRALDGRTSAGVKVCMRMNQPIVIVRNSVGSEDSFCRFPDGSLVSNGTLEQYKMRVIQ